MSFGQSLRKVTRDRGETQDVPARISFVSPSLVGKIMKGTRKAPKDLMKATVEHYDEPELAFAAANEVTGGAWVPWLNNADLHRANTQLKTMEELEEALAALRMAPVTKHRDQMNDRELASIRDAIKECIEAVTALTHHIAVLCKEYCFSWMTMWKEHRLKLKASKYIK